MTDFDNIASASAEVMRDALQAQLIGVGTVHVGAKVGSSSQFVVRAAYTSLLALAEAVTAIRGSYIRIAQPSPRVVNNGNGAEIHFDIEERIA